MIYLDYSATTPLDSAVLKKMLPYFSRDFANPASIHSVGQSALKAVEDARHEFAKVLNLKASELIFCSGATEANNLALQGLAKALRGKGDKRNHIITSSIEHDSILEPLHALEKYGYTITRLPVNKEGVISLSSLEHAITDETMLVSIGFVNSEVGSIQPVSKIGRLIRKINERRMKEWLNTQTRKRGARPQPIYFHSDATQAANYFSCSAKLLNVDMLSFSGHKVFGPKGIGLLTVKRDTPLEALLYGGHQERNLRSGTLNVPAIIGFAEAFVRAQKNYKKSATEVTILKNYFARELKKAIPQIKESINLSNASAAHANFLFTGVGGDALVAALDEAGVAASTGSACASGDLSASHTITSLGYTESEARSALRFTLSRLNTKKDLKTAVKRIKQAYTKAIQRFEKASQA